MVFIINKKIINYSNIIHLNPYYQKKTKTHISIFCYTFNSQQSNQSHKFQHIHSIRNKKQKKQPRGLIIYSPIPKKSVVLSFIPKSSHPQDHNFNERYPFIHSNSSEIHFIISYLVSNSKVQKIKWKKIKKNS